MRYNYEANQKETEQDFQTIIRSMHRKTASRGHKLPSAQKLLDQCRGF